MEVSDSQTPVSSHQTPVSSHQTPVSSHQTPVSSHHVLVHRDNDIQTLNFGGVHQNISKHKANHNLHSNSLRSEMFHRHIGGIAGKQFEKDNVEMTVNIDNHVIDSSHVSNNNHTVFNQHKNDNVFTISPLIGDISPISKISSSKSCSVLTSQSYISHGNKQSNTSPYSNLSSVSSSKSHVYHSSPSSSEQSVQDSPILFKTPARDNTHYNPPVRTPKDSYVPMRKLANEFHTQSESRIINPFEAGIVDKLNLPAFSPSTFTVISTPSTDGRSPKPFHWSIDQIASLKPADIDEMPHHQERYVSPDKEMEERAQKAIDQYFANHNIAPSPWNSNPKPFTLPCTPTAQMGYMVPFNMDELKGSVQKELSKKRRTQEVSCQTILTLPVDFDMNKVLERYMTHKPNEEVQGEELSTSSLRRKLFFQGDENSSFSPVKLCNNEPFQRIQRESPTVSPVKRQPTPEWERITPLKTPSSAHFASSPIHTNSSKIFPHLRRTSSAEAEFLASPELSPINRRHSGGHAVRKSRSSGEFAPMSSLCTSPIEEKFSDEELPPLPSPNMSPIRKELGASYLPDNEEVSDESTPHASNPRSFNSKVSQFTLSPQFPTLGSPIVVEATAMETEGFKSCDAITDVPDFSITEMETTNDSAPLPNSTNQDTGYQTTSIQLTSLHTNLTSQFSSLPLKTETSIDPNDLGDSFNYSQSNPSSALESEVSDRMVNMEGDSLLFDGKCLDKAKIISRLYPDSLHVLLNPVGSSTPTKGGYDLVKQNLFQHPVQDTVPLGSEVALQILKRAGEDLARFTETQ